MISLLFLPLLARGAPSGAPSGPPCCSAKTVGGVQYTLTRKQSGVMTRYNCLSNCVYQREDRPTSHFCFSHGELEVECNESGTEESGTKKLQLSQGWIEGSVLATPNGGSYLSVTNIPYASPPVGSLRWAPPQPATAWHGVRDGTGRTTMCIQLASTGIVGQEDCLVLNVHVPIQESNEPLPVLVWIHGGGLISGSSGAWLGPDFLMEYGVVVVEINYRLGMLGFLSLDSPEVSGNQAIRDQTLALEWVQENIGDLQGDPARVTIAGESGGSWSVFHQLVSPQAKGLFRAAIGQSGHLPAVPREVAGRTGQLLAERLGCWEGGEWQAEVVEECLKTKTAAQVVEAQGAFRSTQGLKVRGNVDSFSSHGPVLPDAPDTLMAEGRFHQVPVLLGMNSGEAVGFITDFIANPEYLLAWNNPAAFGTIVAQMFERVASLQGADFNECDIPNARAALAEYFGEGFTAESLPDVVDFLTAIWVGVGMDRIAGYLAPRVPVFQYLLTFQDNTSITAVPSAKGLGLGVPHVDDLFYMWKADSAVIGQLGMGTYELWSEANRLTSRRFLEMWTNFVRFLEPTPADSGSEALEGVDWKRVDPQDRQYLLIDTDLSMGVWPELQQRMDFWNTTLNNCNQSIWW